MLHKNQVQTLPKRVPTAKQRKSCPAPQRPAKPSRKASFNWLGHLVAIAIVGVCAYAIVTGGKP